MRLCFSPVRGVCDFFRGEVAFLALGKARPELWSIQEALEELFPEPSHYRADALQAWERRLRPAPDKAAKADSGYSEGTDGSETHTQQETHQDTNTHTKTHHSTNRASQSPYLADNIYNTDTKRSYKKHACRKPTHPPNHLQKVRVRGGARERRPSLIGPIKQEGPRAADTSFSPPILCEKCSGERARHQSSEHHSQIPGRVPLPPVSRRQQGSSPVEQEVREPGVPPSPPPAQPVSVVDERCLEQLQLLSTNPLPGLGPRQKETQQRATFDLPSDRSDVTLLDIERCYDIGHVVGDGNFAVVRECRRRDNGQTLAIKIIERSKLIGREHMMQNELSLLGSLSHPRVVRLFTHHHTHTHSYLVMELVTGGDLFEAIAKRGKFPEAEAALMVSDVSDALSYIHSKSIVHRDLKPENLLMELMADGSSRLKLGDFGLAMVVTEPIFTICGTPTYVAPEILSETGYGVAVDVWALGVILYILLCGFPPFRSRERDQEELFQLIKQGELHFLSPYWDPISEGARGLVRALLQVDPSVRLTAVQTLLHPWVLHPQVQAINSSCSQGALTHKPQKNTAECARDSEGLTQINAVEAPKDKGLAHTSSQGVLTHKTQVGTAELNKEHERQTESSSGTALDQEKPAQQLSTEKSTVQMIPEETKADTPHTPTEDRPDQQKPESPPSHDGLPCKELSKQETQGPGDSTSNTKSNPVSSTSPTNKLNQLCATPVQTQLTSPVKTHLSEQNSLQKSPTDSSTPPTSANPAPPRASSQHLNSETGCSPPPATTTNQSDHHSPSTEPAAPSSTHSLHQQSLTLPSRTPSQDPAEVTIQPPTSTTSGTGPAQNLDDPIPHTTITHPPTPTQSQPLIINP
ncbi:serine/threonine-protein kinase DCLK1 [Myripristis murdjan]|uniref:serine/threonine-protein kinase DCLK1 n=1 Tax=Myripristis murdjan TaxID=586833 RepID=UPI0011762EF3|nr:serine/threonine-protein kinase DCLK3 [Myripristis murdjan]